MESRRIVSCIARLTVGLLFLSAGLLKFVGFSEFLEQVRQYRLLPESVVPSFAGAIVLLETVCGFMVLAGIRVHHGAYALSVLAAIFLIAVSWRVVVGDGGSCGCFGGIVDETIGPAAILRNAGILVLCILVARSGARSTAGR